VGFPLGLPVGCPVGFREGWPVGLPVGWPVGFCVGSRCQTKVGDAELRPALILGDAVNLWISASLRCAPVGISLDATHGSSPTRSARSPRRVLVLVVVTSGQAASRVVPCLPRGPAASSSSPPPLLATMVGLLENLPAGHGACRVAPCSAGKGSRRVRPYSRSSQGAWAAFAA